ncbi:MAG: ABC transporter ATP-binding protein [Oscillospiraceae bacterium]|nr:ABC transporter ATP-binding protein [Oscillospiraceae bacterium]
MKITLKNLSKIFPPQTKKGSPVHAVDKVSLEIPDGKLLGLLGPSGCGKSTMLNLLCGLLTPTEGEILFDEDNVTALAPQHRGVGMVFQNYALYPHLTVLQNILFPLENLKGKEKLTRAQMLSRAREAAGLVQIQELLDRKPAQLSGGQQQRVAIARALVKLPRVLLLDEPLSNLDARLRLQTREEIKRIQKATGITTVFVTHDQEEAMSICDEIVVMDKGQIQQMGHPQKIYDDPANLFVAKFLGTPPIHVFSGNIADKTLYLDNAPILPVNLPDGEVTVAIRPEGFLPDETGALQCQFQGLEVMGRDTAILCTHPACAAPIRAIVESGIACDTARFSIKQGKIFFFDTNGNRLYLGD